MLFDRGKESGTADEAHLARIWEEVRTIRDARLRRNAWCLICIMMIVWRAIGHETLLFKV
jgi:type IV secretory pathway component VirB8